jgi:energy-converting hydrogenase Eha subunit B
MFYKILKEGVLFLNFLAVLAVAVLLGALLPGDRFNVNTLGSLVAIVLVAMLDLAVTLPSRAVLRRRGIDLFEGIKVW